MIYAIVQRYWRKEPNKPIDEVLLVCWSRRHLTEDIELLASGETLWEDCYWQAVRIWTACNVPVHIVERARPQLRALYGKEPEDV